MKNRKEKFPRCPFRSRAILPISFNARLRPFHISCNYKENTIIALTANCQVFISITFTISFFSVSQSLIFIYQPGKRHLRRRGKVLYAIGAKLWHEIKHHYASTSSLTNKLVEYDWVQLYHDLSCRNLLYDAFVKSVSNEEYCIQNECRETL